MIKDSTKNTIIILLVIVIAYMGTVIYECQNDLSKLNKENERLQIENDRIGHLLRLSTEALKRGKRDAPHAHN